MGISGRNKLPGTVREIERSGPVAKVVLDVEGGRSQRRRSMSWG
ncbi:MAG: TOBE domain-containing protein [Limnochordia bacterium]|jgi:molybdopterin-binding protein